MLVAGIAIFCMLLTYYMWIKAVKTGTIYWSTLAALAYFYMVGIFKEITTLIHCRLFQPLLNIRNSDLTFHRELNWLVSMKGSKPSLGNHQLFLQQL
jgi:hypothetical protein